MRIHRAYWSLPKDALFAAVAIGNFDGVHRGHRVLIDAARARAEVLGAPLGVVTFEPHPREVLMPDKAPPRITALRTKARLLRSLGVEQLYALAFDEILRNKSPEAFIHDVLAGGLGVRQVVVGYDFRFGHKRAGDVATLQALGEAYQFEVSVVEPVTWKDHVCSSSRIREAVQQGDVALAADLLGHPFLLEGRVVHGDGRGQSLGYPTANLRPHSRRPLIPPSGVYAVRAGINGGDGLVWRDAVASLGVRPTFDGHDFLIEIHLFDVHPDLYGQRLWCCFIERLRGEESFASAADLIAQMDRDSLRARAVLAQTPAIPIQ